MSKKISSLIIPFIIISIAFFLIYINNKDKNIESRDFQTKLDSILILKNDIRDTWSLVNDLVNEKNTLKRENDLLNQKVLNWRKWYKENEKDVRSENLYFLINVIEEGK